MTPTPEAPELPPLGTISLIWEGPVMPHWRVEGDTFDRKDRHLIDEFRTRAMARLSYLPQHDPQFRRNKERVNRDAERERLTITWYLGYDDE